MRAEEDTKEAKAVNETGAAQLAAEYEQAAKTQEALGDEQGAGGSGGPASETGGLT